MKTVQGQKWIISAGANLYRGYNLETVFKSVSNLGFQYVDLDWIKPPPSSFKGKGYGAHITEEDFKRVKEIRNLMEDYGLETVTFSGHMFLITKEDVELFQKKMEFAKELGASYIATNQGPKTEAESFYRNLEIIEKRARELNITVCLETEMPGDMICNANDAQEVFARFSSLYLGLTYDFGNVFYSHKGSIDLINDFQKALPFIKTLHFKDAKFENDALTLCPIGEGVINFKTICGILKNSDRKIPITIETPYFFRSKNWAPFETANEIKPIEEIEKNLKTSLSFIEKNLLGQSGEQK